ncbi:MAG: GFA family protein [Rhodocyclaceae bacterium]
MAQYRLSCHCGAIAGAVEGDLSEVLECNCSHCSRKGYLLWFVSPAQLALSTPHAAMSTYTFNRHVIQHHFCPTCGCAPFGEGVGPDGAPTIAINARCIEALDLTHLTRIPYDGRAA